MGASSKIRVICLGFRAVRLANVRAPSAAALYAAQYAAVYAGSMPPSCRV